MATVADLINQSYNAAGVIATTGETMSAQLLADAFLLLKQLTQSWSTNLLLAVPWRITNLALAAGSIEYTLGPGLTWNTTGTSGAAAYPIAITGWGCRYQGALKKGGKPLSYEAFQEKVSDDLGTSALIIREFGYHQQSPMQAWSAPLMLCLVWPTPATSPGVVDLEYMTTVPDFASTSATINMPPGYELALMLELAIVLENIYRRPGGPDPVLAGNARNAKSNIMSLNAMNLGLPAPQ